MSGPPLLLVEALATRNDSGLGRLARLIVDGLAGLAGGVEGVGGVDIRVLLPEGGTYRPGSHCRTIPVNAKPFRLWSQVAFPLIIRRLRPTAVLCLGQTLPRWRPASRYALMVPDAGPLEDLGIPASSHDAYNRRWLRAMPARADRLLTIGGFSRDRLSRLLGIPPERISVVKPIDRGGNAGHGAASPPRAASTGPAGPRGDRGASARAVPSGPYFLAVGNVEPRKNFPGLIAAYARLRNRRADAPPLYIVGHKAWGYAEAEAAARAHGVDGSVVFTGFVDDAAREALIAGCTLFVSSSLYEGWGLPLFEALSLGRPAIYHGGTSQDEFAEGFALKADCADPEALSRAMESLWLRPDERARLESALARGFGAVRDYDLGGALRDALGPLLSRGA